MIFIRCKVSNFPLCYVLCAHPNVLVKDGISHNPAEYSSPSDM
jgi:hypothetical protein